MNCETPGLCDTGAAGPSPPPITCRCAAINAPHRLRLGRPRRLMLAPSRCNLLPLSQLHRGTQLDLVEHGLQLRLGNRRPICLEQPRKAPDRRPGQGALQQTDSDPVQLVQQAAPPRQRPAVLARPVLRLLRRRDGAQCGEGGSVPRCRPDRPAAPGRAPRNPSRHCARARSDDRGLGPCSLWSGTPSSGSGPLRCIAPGVASAEVVPTLVAAALAIVQSLKLTAR
jgi:hypothetical protein